MAETCVSSESPIYFDKVERCLERLGPDKLKLEVKFWE